MSDFNPQHRSKDRSSLQIDWKNVVDTAMDGVICIDERQEIILFNAAAQAIFEWSEDEVLGRPITVLIPERFRERHHAFVERFAKEPLLPRRMGPQRTVMALRANGEEFPIEASISHYKSGEERIYTVILRDVTEATRNRSLIHQQTQMLDQVSDVIYAIDLEGKIGYWNNAAERFFGWSATQVLGRHASELLHPNDTGTLSEIQRIIESERVWIGELTIVTREGKTIVVEHQQVASVTESGEVLGYLCITRDVTTLRRQDREQRRSQRLESIGTLAGGIAHDLNNLLSPILMGAKLLSSGKNVNQQGILQTMVASAERGTLLVRQLLTFAGGLRGERRLQRIDELVNETRSILEHTLPKSVGIETRVAFELPLVIGDPTELSQVLMNLCINARDAMPDGGVLTIEADSVHVNGTKKTHPDARPGDYVLLKVADTGMGMTSEVLDRIFSPFFTTKEIGRGTGFGLATVQGIVKSHEGFVTVYSELGRGSTFCVYLPATHPAQSKLDADGSQIDEPSGNGRTILLVDDEAPIRQMTGLALESAGYRVLLARDGLEAVELFRQHRTVIAAVVLDMMMPGMDGLQLIDKLKQIDPTVISIACSGLQTSEREAAVMAHGANAFVAKPYSDEKILTTLSTLLDP